MMIKIYTQTIAVLIMVFASITVTASPPKPPGTFYDNGPLSPFIATTNMSAAERAAYSLLEGVIQIAEAKINSTSCDASVGTSDIEIFTDGSEGLANKPFNFVKVLSVGGSYTLEANVYPSVFFRGQRIVVNQKGFGLFNGTLTLNYSSDVKFNSSNNMMKASGRVDVMGLDGFTTRYSSNVIKAYNRGSVDSENIEYYSLYQWGLQAQELLGYPVNKYWQRFKSLHSGSELGITIFVVDRLVGETPCRIEINLEGVNNLDFFWQLGTLAITTDTPDTPVLAFD